MTKKRTIFIGVIPDIFGYGICVAEESEKECMKALRRSYNDWKKSYPNNDTNFKKSYDYWGGSITEVELGKSYFDNFRE